MRFLERFREVWLVDFEFISEPGERPVPVCMVAHEACGGQKLRLWQDQFGKEPPFGIEPDSLFVAYYSPAELGCFLSLGWPMPTRILDLFVEFRNLTNGWPTLAGNSLLGALAHFGLDGIGAGEKEEMRERILAGGPWSRQDQRDIWIIARATWTPWAGSCPPCCHKSICRAPSIEAGIWPPIAAMEFHGVPVNRGRLDLLRENWETIQDRLIATINPAYQVFDGPHFQTRPVRALASPQQYFMAQAGERPTRSGGRHVPGNVQNRAGSGSFARAATCAVGYAPERPGRGF